MNRIILTHIAERVSALMLRKNLIFAEATRPVFYVWPQEDRVILAVDPELVKNQQRLLSDEFRHDLSTVLAGRKVRMTNSRCIFIQVAWVPDHAPRQLRPETLDMTAQPSPLHVPIGMTRNGPLWLPVVEMDAVLIGGSRGMGKTRLIHSWVQALIRGGQAKLYLYDGKIGTEFARYGSQNGVRIVSDLREALVEIQSEMARRRELFRTSGATSLAEHNGQNPDGRLPVIVLVVDEVAHIQQELHPMLSDLVGTGRAAGIYPVLATTYPGHKEVQSLVRANLSTRIAFPVPTQSESRVILGQAGAESIPKVKGRLLMVWEARLVEAQAFNVTLPSPGAIYLGPVLSGREFRIANDAVAGGRLLSIALLMQSYKMTEWEARQLLRSWQNRGWIEADRYNRNARRITPLFEQIIAQSSQGTQSAQVAQTVEVAHEIEC